MKQTPLDVLLCGGVIALLMAASLVLVGCGLSPLFRAWLGDYHVLAALASAMLSFGIMSGLAIRCMLYVRPLKPGRYSMDSCEFTYWKLLVIIIMAARWMLSPFTTVLFEPLLARLFGASIGRNVAMGGVVGEPFLLTLGEGAVLGSGSCVSGSMISDGFITLGPVHIGAGATVGVNAVILAGTTIGDHAILAGGSIVIPGTTIPAGESWRGNPARKWSAPAVAKPASPEGPA